MFSVNLYKITPTAKSIKVGVEYLSEYDAKLLKYDIDETETMVIDQFQYHEDIKEDLPMMFKTLHKEVEITHNQIKSDRKGQLRLKFDEEDDTKHQEELRAKKKELINRIDQIEEGKFIGGIELELPELDS